MTDGEKATIIRTAVRDMLNDHLPDTAHAPRATMREVANLPAVSLALFFDAIEAAKGGAK